MTTYKDVTVEQLLDYLSDKTLEFKCRITTNNYPYYPLILLVIRHDARDGVIACLNEDDEIVHFSDHNHYEVLGKPVMIGDVLEMLDWPATDRNIVSYQTGEFINLWHYAGGCNKSLNEIFSEEISQDCSCDSEYYCGICHKEGVTFSYKDPRVQALFEFVVDIFHNQIKR